MRIRQNSVFLSQLVKDVARGALVPAAFQRPYVWGKEDVLALCESVLAGFPLGGFLTWSPARGVPLERVARRRLGPVVPSGESALERLLLDGQNRLASIAWMLLDADTPVPTDLSPMERETWAGRERLVIDAAQEKILFVPAAEADAGFRLPARCALPGTDFNVLVRERWDDWLKAVGQEAFDKGMRWVDRAVRDQFSDARVVETLMENATVAEAKSAFLHICKVGVPMGEQDFDQAVAWALE